MERQYFVYDGLEVVKTGRIASRAQEVRGYNGSRKVLETVVEITPIVKDGSLQWKKWVREDELYVINDADADKLVPVDDHDNQNYDVVDDILSNLRNRNLDGKA